MFNCDILTNDGATLRTVDIICADFHPAVEVHLRERLHVFSEIFHSFILLKYVDVITLLPPRLDGPYEGPRRRKS